MWLQSRLDLVAEPESGDRQVVWDTYRKGLLLTLSYPAPFLGNINPAKIM